MKPGNHMPHFFKILLTITVLIISFHPSQCQPEVTAWSNFEGIRVEGQLMEFESSLSVATSDWSNVRHSGKEWQQSNYTREGKKQKITLNFSDLHFTEVVESTGKGTATVNVEFTSKTDTVLNGAYFCITFSGFDTGNRGNIELINPDLTGADLWPKDSIELMNYPARGLIYTSKHRRIEVKMEDTSNIIVRKPPHLADDKMQAYFTIASDTIQQGQKFNKVFKITASGDIDKSPGTLDLNTSETGRKFAGLGGNFRLQNPKTYPQVIQYCMDNLRLAWSRVELPWAHWHPEEGVDPLEAAKNGKIHPRVKAAMEMAKRLDNKGIPVILAAWFPPQWAAKGELRFRPENGVFGNALRQEKMDKIYESITSYILYLKEHYGVEVKMFSFNESDLGINVRQTSEEHAELNKGLGAYMASKGLKTKMVLGDTADGNGYDFITTAMNDPETHPYISAVSFHSWRGWADTTFTKWHHAAEKLDIPLIIGEGSIDAQAWRYPAILLEPTYARKEINLYVRIMAMCQPLSILQWQLTADYSPMAGGGIFGNDKPLHPTQRFWNLKQLASTPKDVYAMDISSDKDEITCAALGNNKKGNYAIHMVNNGPTREVTLKGLPKKVKSLEIYVTDSTRKMKKGENIDVTNGQAKFTLESTTYTTLMTEP